MSEKRIRTSYLLHRRYKRTAEGAALVGATIGLALTIAAFMPAISAGEPLPPTSFAIGIIIIIALAFLPYMAVRWRWRQIRRQLDD